MSPKYQESDHLTKINGPPKPFLRINKDSHAIRSSSSAKRQPVIIYTHSPKVIHAQSRDFMALVQKLTGMSRADGDKAAKSEDSGEKGKGKIESSAEERYDQMQRHEPCSSAVVPTPMYKVSNNYVVDAPLYTPNSNEYFCSPRQNPMFQTPSSISPSFMAFPDY